MRVSGRCKLQLRRSMEKGSRGGDFKWLIAFVDHYNLGMETSRKFTDYLSGHDEVKKVAK